MKKIVTHFAPDTDAVTSVWLLKRFLSEWKAAELFFVPAGKTLDNMVVDSDSEVLHVDTGMGMLDHHQIDDGSCAAIKVINYIKKAESVKRKGKSNKFPDEALVRLVDVVNVIDHFHEVYFPNPTADFYDFGLVAILDGIKLLYPDDHQKLVDMGMLVLDGIHKTLQNKVWAEKEIKENGIEFETKWGKGIGIETVNDEVLKIAQRQGYVLALRKDPKKNYVRIKALPESSVNFTSCYNKYKRLDKKATWYLHASRKMILNGSAKNSETRPTSLTLREIIEVLKKA